MLRRTATLAFLGLVLGAGAARAQTQAARQHAYHAQRAGDMGLSPYHWLFFAQASAGRDAAVRDSSALFGSLEVGADIAFHSDNCELFVAGAHGRLLAMPGGVDLSAAQWASACLTFAGGPALAAGHHFEWQAVPALSAPLTTAAEPYSRESLGFELIMYNVPLRSGLLQLGRSPWRFTFDVGADENDADPDDFRIELALDLVRLMRHGRRGAGDRAGRWLITGPGLYYRDYFAAVGSYVRRSATVVGARLASVENLPVGLVGLRVDADVKLVGGRNMAVLEDTIANNEVTTGAVSVRIHRMLGVAGVSVLPGERGLHPVWYGGASFDRDLWPTLAHDMVLEDRGALWASLVSSASSATLRAFLARTQLYTATDISRHVTGGGELTLDHDLGGHLVVQVQVEAARSFYAVLDGDEHPLPRWGLRAFAALAYRRRGGRD